MESGPEGKAAAETPDEALETPQAPYDEAHSQENEQDIAGPSTGGHEAVEQNQTSRCLYAMANFDLDEVRPCIVPAVLMITSCLPRLSKAVEHGYDVLHD